MQIAVMRGATACLVVVACLSTIGCATQPTHHPSIKDEPVVTLATLCQLANRDIRLQVSMPELRGRCGAWSDRQTAVMGF